MTAIEMERRLGELRTERTAAESAASAARDAVARALVDGASPADLAKRRKVQAEAAANVEALDAAIALAERELSRLQCEEQAKAEASAIEGDISAMLAIADTLPEIGEHLDAVISLVAQITPPASMRRHDLFGALGAAFRGAVYKANAGKPASVQPAIEALAESWRRNAERRALALAGGAVEKPAAAGPLEPDTAIYALTDFDFSDAGDRDVASRGVRAGALLLVPRVVAVAALSAGVAELIAVAPGRRVRLLSPYRLRDGRQIAAGAEWLLAPEEAATLPAGVAEPLGHLLPHEIAQLRSKFPTRESRRPRVALGVFSASDAKKAAPMVPEKPDPLAEIDRALGAVEAAA